MCGGGGRRPSICRRQSISICSLHLNPSKPGLSEEGLTNLLLHLSRQADHRCRLILHVLPFHSGKVAFPPPPPPPPPTKKKNPVTIERVLPTRPSQDGKCYWSVVTCYWSVVTWSSVTGQWSCGQVLLVSGHVVKSQ